MVSALKFSGDFRVFVYFGEKRHLYSPVTSDKFICKKRWIGQKQDILNEILGFFLVFLGIFLLVSIVFDVLVLLSLSISYCVVYLPSK